MIRSTSREAFHSVQHELAQRQQTVFDALSKFTDASNLELSHAMGLDINQITPRIYELREKGLVEESRRGICAETHRKVIYWRVTTVSVLFSTVPQPPTAPKEPEPIHIADRSFFSTWKERTQQKLCC